MAKRKLKIKHETWWDLQNEVLRRTLCGDAEKEFFKFFIDYQGNLDKPVLCQKCFKDE